MMDIVRNPGRMRRWAVIATVLSVGTLTAACSSNSTSSTTTTSAASVPAGLSVSSFNSSFTEMPQFKGLTHRRFLCYPTAVQLGHQQRVALGGDPRVEIGRLAKALAAGSSALIGPAK